MKVEDGSKEKGPGKTNNIFYKFSFTEEGCWKAVKMVVFKKERLVKI